MRYFTWKLELVLNTLWMIVVFRNNNSLIAGKNYAKTYIKIFCSSPILLDFLLWSTHFAQSFLYEPIFFLQLVLVLFKLQCFYFSIIHWYLSQIFRTNTKCVSCGKVPNLAVFPRHYFHCLFRSKSVIRKL